ncbi:recombinase family protein [Plantactinospora sp. GCM10030261]|uniref:recombinase family protein n=1 Tax=Plantactinospora sp. GCM10030261 TaxID=3273420 RepID=UPI00360C4EC9
MPPHPEQPRVTAIYLRLSKLTDRSVSLDAQLAECMALCERNGWANVRIYRDESRTASNARRKRAAYEQMLADVRAGLVERIVCRDDDRLVRQPIELEGLINTLEPGSVPVWFAAGSELDLTTSRGRENARIRGAIARGEVERKSERQKSSNRERVTKGKPLGTVRPFGYTYAAGKLTVVPEEAEAIRWAVEHVMRGGTVSDVAREWTRRGHTVPKTKGPYSWPSAKGALTNPYICGHLQYQPTTILSPEESKRVPVWKAELIKGTWEPIISREDWTTVVQVLTRTRSKAGNYVKYLGAGIFVCGLCGGKVRSGWTTVKGRKFRNYKCVDSKPVTAGASRMHFSLKADPIDDYVTDVLTSMLQREDFADFLSPQEGPDRPALEAERKELEEELEALTASYGLRRIRLTQLETGTAAIEKRLTEIDEALAGTVEQEERAARYAPASREQWENSTIEQQRLFLRDLLPVVRIFPAGSNPAPSVPVYVHAYDRRGRLRPLPVGPDEVEMFQHQEAHAGRYDKAID